MNDECWNGGMLEYRTRLLFVLRRIVYSYGLFCTESMYYVCTLRMKVFKGVIFPARPSQAAGAVSSHLNVLRHFFSNVDHSVYTCAHL